MDFIGKKILLFLLLLSCTMSNNNAFPGDEFSVKSAQFLINFFKNNGFSRWHYNDQEVIINFCKFSSFFFGSIGIVGILTTPFYGLQAIKEFFSYPERGETRQQQDERTERKFNRFIVEGLFATIGLFISRVLYLTTEKLS